MRPTTLMRVLLLAGALLAAAALTDVRAVLDAVSRADPAWLLLVGIATGVSTVAKALTWRGCLAALPGAGPVRRTDLLGPFLVGALVNAGTPARAGDALRVTMARRAVRRRGGDVGLAEVAGSVVAEHLVSTAVWGALVVCVAPLLPLPAEVRAAAAAIGAAAVALIVVAARGGTAPRAPLPAGRIRGAVRDAVSAIHHAACAIRGPRVFAEVTASAVLHWVGQWAAVWAVLAGCGMPGLGPLVAAGVVVAVALAHALPVTPGGIGTVQAGVALPLIAAGVAGPEALAAGVVLQGVETAVHAAAGLLFLTRPGRTPAGSAADEHLPPA
ncbi:MAG: lysylphosphatidylglycerol synthase transmembrane domain-containing protein [Thermoleophilia bacterium]